MGVVDDLVTDALQPCDQIAVLRLSDRGGRNQDLLDSVLRRIGSGNRALSRDPRRSRTAPGLSPFAAVAANCSTGVTSRRSHGLRHQSALARIFGLHVAVDLGQDELCREET